MATVRPVTIEQMRVVRLELGPHVGLLDGVQEAQQELCGLVLELDAVHPPFRQGHALDLGAAPVGHNRPFELLDEMQTVVAGPDVVGQVGRGLVRCRSGLELL